MGAFPSNEEAQAILPQTDKQRPEGRSTSGDTVNCPTCQGTGRIPRGQENKLVAVISCTDQRLKPRRTKLYVCVSVGLCLLFSGLFLFFLFPRSVALSELGLQSAYVFFTPTAVNATILHSLEIRNDNFATVEASDLTVQVFYVDTVVGAARATNVTTIPPRSKKKHSFEIRVSLTDPGLNKYCKTAFTVHVLFLKLQVSMTVYYLAHYEQLSLETFQYLDCGANRTTAHVFNGSQ
ncbi:transmembrane protein 106B-like [Clupea harengus]|uniref:Transmembrane protein 106B-like n=1 Tax=Clupea harengus TaxID=7950 RepID=A0A6P8F7F7_CLUHA|nr:transmembrane protein 106B-like [Clupea harengus]XP_031421034.1 transmembrane protein 106B-like [Clupea harengus]XP_031421041.1 transmembrane protein 106B-like [Clupea harengus]XP_042566339.1 transmembrane protein 106B-like [Clupea harengus]